MSERWRVGRSVGRTIYIGDRLVGLMDTPELAQQVVDAVNWEPGEAWYRELVEAARAVVRREWPVSPSAEVARLRLVLRRAAAGADHPGDQS